MSNLALRFDQVKESDRDRAGGKGYNLAHLHQAGFPVPTGFIITTDAYHTFLAANGLDALILDALEESDFSTASAQIRAAFEKADMPPAIAAAIRDAYVALGLGETAVAVRSSASTEDGVAASFAGQYETILGVVGCGAMLSAVHRCWISLWSERALSYRQPVCYSRAHRSSQAAMAVVVQQAVPAVQAGVAFTIDPVSGRDDVIIVEAIAGMGAALVSGHTTPHRYVVQWGETHPKAEKGVLDDARLATVVHLAQEVASWAGQPQDVEWALDEKENVHLLQARPITGDPGSWVSPEQSDTVETAEAISAERIVHWTRDNVGEVIPEPVTPLSWSVLDSLGNSSFASVLQRLGINDYPEMGLFGRFFGRVYFNQTLFQGMMSRFYLSHAGWRAVPRLMFTAFRALLLLRRLPKQSEEVIEAILNQRRSEDGLDLAELALPDVLGRLRDWRGLGTTAMEAHLAISVMAELFFQGLDKFMDQWGEGVTTTATLISGLKGVRSAEAGRALAVLAQKASQDEPLRALVLATEPDALSDRLAKTEIGRALGSEIEAFLAEHGHCAMQEFELAAPRWEDEPEIILSVLQAQVRAAVEDPVSDPAVARLNAVGQIEKQIGPLKRWIFRRLLRWTQALTITRENLKYHFVIAHSRLRSLYLTLATRIVANGRLSDPGDVFFLTAEEVLAYAEGKPPPDYRHERIARRRKTWNADRRVVPPLGFNQRSDGRLSPVSSPDAPGDNNGQLMSGLAASPGSYTGQARVLLTPADGADLQPGEVLVAPATSPGWAPLFLAAGALITEIGGTLSHGAIIAREYGLPAVLNVTNATRHIRTGQLVHVDGSKGSVQILGEAP